MVPSEWKYLVPVVALVGLLAAGCSDGGSPLAPPDPSPSLAGDEFAVLDAEDAFAHVEDATLDKAMTMEPVMAGGMFVRHAHHPRHSGSHLRPGLWQLGLTRDQVRMIFDLVRTHREDVRSALEGLRQVNQEWIDEAREERQAILQQLQSGEITTDEARDMLRQLSEDTREAIRDNPANAPYLQAICNARTDLLEGIREILTPEQQATWDAWVAGLDGHCQTI